MATPIRVATPHPADAPFDQDKYVALVTNSGLRFLVDRNMLMTVSNLARSLLESAGNEEAIPLDSPHATDKSVAHFATWLNYHADPLTVMARMEFPLAEGDKKQIFPAWDLQFIEEHLVPGGDMRHYLELYMLAGLSVFLGATTLQEMCCGYIAWQIRDVTEKSKEDGAPTASSVARSWFGLSGDYTEAELKELVEKFRWCRDVDYNQLEQDCDDAHDRVVERQKRLTEAATATAAA